MRGMGKGCVERQRPIPEGTGMVAIDKPMLEANARDVAAARVAGIA